MELSVVSSFKFEKLSKPKCNSKSSLKISLETPYLLVVQNIPICLMKPEFPFLPSLTNADDDLVRLDGRKVRGGMADGRIAEDARDDGHDGQGGGHHGEHYHGPAMQIVNGEQFSITNPR